MARAPGASPGGPGRPRRLPQAGAGAGHRALSWPHHQHPPRAAARRSAARGCTAAGCTRPCSRAAPARAAPPCTWWTRCTIAAPSWPRRGFRSLPGDTPERLAARVLEAEHRLLPAVVLAAAAAGRPVPIPRTRGVQLVIVVRHAARADLGQRQARDRRLRPGPGRARLGDHLHRWHRGDAARRRGRRCTTVDEVTGLPRAARRTGQDAAPGDPRRAPGPPRPARAPGRDRGARDRARSTWWR